MASLKAHWVARAGRLEKGYRQEFLLRCDEWGRFASGRPKRQRLRGGWWPSCGECACGGGFTGVIGHAIDPVGSGLRIVFTPKGNAEVEGFLRERCRWRFLRARGVRCGSVAGGPRGDNFEHSTEAVARVEASLRIHCRVAWGSEAARLRTSVRKASLVSGVRSIIRSISSVGG